MLKLRAGYEVRSSAVDWGTALQAAKSRVRLPMGSLKFFIDLILPAAVHRLADCYTLQNEYYFLISI
jgi:hypothetical protein